MKKQNGHYGKSTQSIYHINALRSRLTKLGHIVMCLSYLLFSGKVSHFFSFLITTAVTRMMLYYLRA